MTSGCRAFKHPLRELMAYIDRRYGDLYLEAAAEFDFSEFEGRFPTDQEYSSVFVRLSEIAFRKLLREFGEQEDTGDLH